MVIEQFLSERGAKIDIRLTEAYSKGRFAGYNNYFEMQRNSGVKPPVCPYSMADYLAGIEWNRGFNDGLAIGPRKRACTSDIYRRKAAQ